MIRKEIKVSDSGLNFKDTDESRLSLVYCIKLCHILTVMLDVSKEITLLDLNGPKLQNEMYPGQYK